MSGNVQQAKPSKNVVMISLKISTFGGYKRTSEEDIVSAGGKIPKSDILTKGGKHIFPLDKLAPFNRIKKGAFRKLWEYGVKSFGGGNVIAICEDDLKSAEADLEASQAEFDAELENLRLNYDGYMAKYVGDQADQATKDIILKSAVSAADACSRFRFSYDAFMPAPVGKHGSVESMASKLTSQLFEEIAEKAEATFNQSFAPKGQIRTVGQRAKSPLMDCRAKMVKMGFLNPNIEGGIKLIDKVLEQTQPDGYIVDLPGNPCGTRLHGMVKLMMDAHAFETASAKLMSCGVTQELIDSLCGIKQQVEVQPEPEAVPVVIAQVTLPKSVQNETPAETTVVEADKFVPPPVSLPVTVRASRPQQFF